jgi:uncharacterized protein with NRDE domain
MCLLAFAWDAHPRYPLVFAGNRDEFHQRPSLPASWWADAPNVLGGRDLQAGGSWLGISRGGRIAVVTNRPGQDAPSEDRRSRGELVTQFLTGTAPVHAFFETLVERAEHYGGFGLIAGDLPELRYFEHDESPGPVVSWSLEPGCIGLSNAPMGTPWPKVGYLEAGIASVLDRDTVDTETLLALLTTREPQGGPPTDDWQENLRATPFILGPQYGTRASTVIVIDRDGHCRFVERRFSPDGSISGETVEEFQIAADGPT